MVVTGAGSVWSNQTTLLLGGNSAGNRADVNDGGWLACSDGSVGSGFSANSNAVVLGGASGWNNLGTLKVGDGGSGNVLIASNGAMVLSSNAFIGANTSLGNHNLAVITGAGTLWSNRNDFTVGNFSVGNQLVVSNGATVYAQRFSVVGGSDTASSNSVTVTGPASRWVPFIELFVGSNGPANRLLISDGGFVDTRGAIIGHQPLSKSNEVVVDGPGSLWNDLNSLWVGNRGQRNRLVVTNGGTVSALSTTIGASSDGTDGQVLVTGAGSVLTNRTFLSINAPRNQLVVSNGGQVFATDLTVLGDFVNSTNNRVVVHNGALRTGRLDVRRGTNLLNAGVIEVDELRLTNTQGFFEFNGGTLITRGAVISNGLPFVVGRSGATPAIWDVRAGMTNTFIAGDLMIGANASFNQLLLTNGALLENNNGFLGISNSSSNNVALVTGAASSWINRSELRVGGSSRGNQLVVSNGGTVFTSAERIIGDNSGANSNTVIVTDAGSLWQGGGEGFSVGRSGAFNRLIVTNGGQVAGVDVSIGAASGGNSNQVVVTDAGSLLTSDTDAFVGENGRANLLVVSNSALVVNSNAYIGFATASSNNVALITGAGTTWSNRGTLFVGESGGGNRLEVGAGARVVSASGEIGSGISASNNVVVVTGPGSVWTNGPGPSLLLGRSGSGNQLVISNGATVWAGVISMAVSAASSNNVAVVTGAGSVLNATLSLGSTGSSNRLFVTDGGVVQGGTSHIGPSSFNVAVISGAGSVWTNSSELLVGILGSGNQLVVSNSGLAIARSSIFLGPNAGASSNRIEIDGGSLVVTNVGFGLFDIRRGTAVLNSGLIAADRLLLTNVGGFLQFNSGTLSVGSSRVSNGTLFSIGDGVSPATMILAGNGLHEFDSLLAVSISSNATLTGNGTIGGTIPLQLLAGSRLVPGTSVGKMILRNSPSLRGTVVMEISKNGAILTNDQIQVIAPLTYGGSLIVSNLGPTALAAGDHFPLFTATSFTGSFSNIALPPLASGLDWTNKLGVDGSIEVISLTQPAFASITLSGTNLIVSGTNGAPGASYTVLTATNVALPVSNWVSIATNQLDSSGNFSFTNAINPAERQRFFQIRIP